MGLVKCSKCGTEINERDIKCNNCGAINFGFNPIEPKEENSNIFEEVTVNLETEVNTSSITSKEKDGNIEEIPDNKEEINTNEQDNIYVKEPELNNEKIDEENKRKKEFLIIGFLIFFITLGACLLFLYKSSIIDNDKDIEDVICIENKEEDIYAIKITSTNDSGSDGNVFSKKSLSPEYFVKTSQKGDIHLVNYRINYENTDECDGDIRWYSVTINGLEQFIYYHGTTVEELTKEEYDAEMTPKEPEKPAIPNTPSVPENTTPSSSQTPSTPSTPPVPPKPTYEITSVDGNGWLFSAFDDGRVCRVDDFNISLEETDAGIKVNYSYKITNINNSDNYCSFSIYMYDEEGYEVADFIQPHDLDMGDNTKYKYYGYISNSESTKFSVKLK